MGAFILCTAIISKLDLWLCPTFIFLVDASGLMTLKWLGGLNVVSNVIFIDASSLWRSQVDKEMWFSLIAIYVYPKEQCFIF